MIALARKYRPKLFADLIVQDHVAAALRGAVVQGRVAHGYLFAGPRGVGKTTAARILAMALNCEKKSEGQGEPCGVCESCRRVWTGQANLDVVELDAASNRGVDDARDLRERAMYAASAEGRSKVYIVDEAHMLTRDAWNALLKILEEPPPGVVFVFATTEPQKIAQSAAPVLSRLQRFDFRRIGPHAIAERLRQVADAEKLAVDDDALALIARSADGGMRDGLSLLDQVLSFGEGPVTADRVREVLGLIPDDLYGELLRLVAERDTTAVFPLVDRLAESGADFGEFVAGAGDVLRAVLQTNLGGEPEGLTEGMQAVIRKYCSVLPAPDIVRLLTVLSSMETQLRSSGHPRLVVELLLLRWAMMDRTVEIGEVIRALGASGTGDVGRGTSTGTRDAGRGTSSPEQLRDSASAAPIPRPASPVPPTTPVPRPASPVPEKGPLSADRLRALWPEIIGRARASSAMLATLLADTTIEGVAGNTVTLAAAGHREGLEHKRDAIGKLLAEWSDGPVKVVLGEPGTRTGERNGPPDRLDRLTAQSANLERLKVLRAKDPTLGAAVDALDLELLE
ncbi:MAG TPA: DNA polymerase III subunit gamma/tau [Gemmatimonadales bacterium]|nr:DNA polymerase III subunit gamma/tau [Gemmatimonadales bacterium]